MGEYIMTYTLYYDFETDDAGIASGLGSGWVFDMCEVLCMGYAIDDGPVLCTNDKDEMRRLIEGAKTLVAYNAEYELGITKYCLGVEFKRKHVMDVYVAAKLHCNEPPPYYGKRVKKWGYSLDIQSAYWLRVKGSDKKATDGLIRESLRLGIISPTVDTKVRKDGTMGTRKQSDSALKKAMFARHGALYKKSPDLVEDYCKIDVDLTRRLHKFFIDNGVDVDTYKLFSEAQKVLVEGKRKGVRIDIEKANELIRKYSEERDYALSECKLLMEEDINLNSPKQKLDYAKKYKIPLLKDSTKACGYTTGEDWYKMIENDYPWARAMSTALSLGKFVKTFLTPIVEKSVAGRLHMNLNLLEAVTGRYSSSNPNLQNQPNLFTQKGKDLRSLFIADEGYEFKCLDFSGQELRMFLHLASVAKSEGIKYKKPIKIKYEDYPNLTKHERELAKKQHGYLLEKNWSVIDSEVLDEMCQGYIDEPDFDGHTVNRKNIYKASGLDMFSDDNAKEGRNVTKTVTFGSLYGQKSKGLMKVLGCDEDTANLILKSFDEGVPFISQLSDLLTYIQIKRGYIKTLAGRKLRFSKPLYKFINYAIQGSSLDQCLIATVQAYHVGIVPSMQVHDEVNSGDWSDEDAELMSFIMENAVKMNIPSLAEVGSGPNWAESK